MAWRQVKGHLFLIYIIGPGLHFEINIYGKLDMSVLCGSMWPEVPQLYGAYRKSPQIGKLPEYASMIEGHLNQNL